MSKRRVPFEANPFGSKTAMVRRRPKRKAPTNKSLNRKIKRIQNDIELKYKDVYSAATDISTTTALTLLNGISQGDTNDNPYRRSSKINFSSYKRNRDSRSIKFI